MTQVLTAGRQPMLTLEKNKREKPSSTSGKLENDLKKVLSDWAKVLNIFLYLAALENKGIKLSQDQKATILAKMKAEQSQFSAELQTYQTDSKKIGSGATTKDETTSNGLNTAGTVATIVAALSGIGTAAALCYAGVVTAPSWCDIDSCCSDACCRGCHIDVCECSKWCIRESIFRQFLEWTGQ